ncbi:MAG: CpaF family protein [Acidimicrobiales bacterium]
MGPASASLVGRVHEQVVQRVEPFEPGDRVEAERQVAALVRLDSPLLDEAAVQAVTEAVLARAMGLGPLEPLLADPRVTDVMVNGGGRVWIDRDGRLVPTDLVLPEPAVLLIVERILAPLGLHVDRSSPVVDARLPDGSRVHAVVRPLAVDGPCLTIRRFAARPVALDEVASSGVASLLAWCVRARSNIVVSGGAGAGKTTLLNALAADIPHGERVITIEDAAELRLPGRHVVRLEARAANAEGRGEVRIRDLVRASLRMRPDRIVVGEVRSGEALDMLQAMNTGHEGSLSTCHANGAVEALRRLETLVLMGDVDLPHAVVREQVSTAVDLVVHVARTPSGRRVIDVAEVGRVIRGDLAVRSLVAGGRLVGLPERAARSGAAGDPEPGWLER